MDDPNRRRHIFGEPRHNLDPLVRQYGGEEAAGQAIENAVSAAFDGGDLIIDDIGLTAYASASGDAICCDGGGVRGVEQSTNIGRFG